MSLKGIEEAIKAFKAKRSGFFTTRNTDTTYIITYINDYDESDEHMMTIGADEDHEQAIIEGWEDYLIHDAPDGILKVTGIQALRPATNPTLPTAC